LRSSSKTAAPSPSLPATFSSEPSANGNALLPASAAGLTSSQGGEVELYMGGSSSMLQTEPSNPSGVNLNLLSDRTAGHVSDAMSHHICICMRPTHGSDMHVCTYIHRLVIDTFRKCVNARRLVTHSLSHIHVQSGTIAIPAIACSIARGTIDV